MNVDAIIFDKDGTLIDFDAYWVAVSVKAIKDALKQLGKEEVPVLEILEAFGVHEGITDMNGALCKGTYAQMGQIVHDILSRYGCESSCDEVKRIVIEAYNHNVDVGEVKPTCPDLPESLSQLKKQGKMLAVVTTDNEMITCKCLKDLGIEALFDKIYTDDNNVPTKPDPYCAFDFCKRFGVDRERVVMVGDTMTDITFAKNAGIKVIALAKSERNKQMLEPYADAVIPRISSLLELLE